MENSAAGIAAKQRYLHLLSKVKNAETLKKGELKELKEFELKMPAKEKTDCIPKRRRGAEKKTVKKQKKSTPSKKKTKSNNTRATKKRKPTRMPVSAALLKKLAFQGVEFPAADKKIKTKVPLADCIRQFPRLKRAWDRGRLLHNIGQEADSGASIPEAESEIGMESGVLGKMLAEDIEAADIWHQNRLSYLKRLGKIIETKAEDGNITAINKIIKMHRNEMAGKSHIDFHRVTQNQMENELGVGRQNLHNWVKGQGLERNSDGTIDLRVFIAWLADFSAAKATRGAGKADMDPLRTRRARKLDMDMAKEAGELLERDAVMAGLLARHQTMLAAHQRKTEELARLCLNQPFEKAKEILAAGFAEIRREMCNTLEQLRLPAAAAAKFVEILKGLKPEAE